MRKIKLLTASLLLLFCSCEPEVSDGFNYKKLSTEFCICTKESRELSAQAKQLNKLGKRQEMLALFEKSGNVAKKALDCCQDKKNHMNRAASLNKTTLEAELRKQCPSIQELLVKEIMNKIK